MVVASQKLTILEIIMKTLTGKERRERKQKNKEDFKFYFGLFIFCFLSALCIKFPYLTGLLICVMIVFGFSYLFYHMGDSDNGMEKTATGVALEIIDGLAKESMNQSSSSSTETPTEPSPYQGPEWTSSQLTIPTETKSTSSRQDE